MIHFVTVNLEQEVHAQALGFTKTVYLYGYGSSDEAVDHVTAYLASQHLRVRKIASASKAVEQDPRRYTFPEQICGLPEDLALEAIRHKALPDGWHAETTAAFYTRREAIATGRQLLQAA